LVCRYKLESPASEYAEALSESMHVYAPEHYIVGNELYLEYKPELIQQVMDYLKPETANVVIYTNEKEDRFYNKTEPWFGTKYKVEGMLDC
jgi:secreted Zn-dependent insulinase-like peptidase